MKKNVILGALCAAMLVSSGAIAVADTRGNGPRGADFSQIDADGNGEVTVAELQAMQTARFGEIDADGDGAVTKAEILAHAESTEDVRRERRVTRMMERLDANDDGSLSAEELTGRRDPARLVERLDADGNGTLSQEEMADARDSMRRGRGCGRRGE